MIINEHSFRYDNQQNDSRIKKKSETKLKRQPTTSKQQWVGNKYKRIKRPMHIYTSTKFGRNICMFGEKCARIKKKDRMKWKGIRSKSRLIQQQQHPKTTEGKRE